MRTLQYVRTCTSTYKYSSIRRQCVQVPVPVVRYLYRHFVLPVQYYEHYVQVKNSGVLQYLYYDVQVRERVFGARDLIHIS
jgi:hypothetical protein